MLIELNIDQIVDEMLALSALRTRQCSLVRGREEPRLFTRDDVPGLRVVMRMVFAELIMELSDVVDQCIFDESDPDYYVPAIHPDVPIRLAVEFQHSDNLPPGMWIPLKRQLEHAVATGTLFWIYTEADPGASTSMHVQYRAVVDAMSEAVRAYCGLDVPTTRAPHW